MSSEEGSFLISILMHPDIDIGINMLDVVAFTFAMSTIAAAILLFREREGTRKS